MHKYHDEMHMYINIELNRTVKMQNRNPGFSIFLLNFSGYLERLCYDINLTWHCALIDSSVNNLNQFEILVVEENTPLSRACLSKAVIPAVDNPSNR